MQVLLCLAQNSGEPVSKEELIRSVWPDTFVTDDVLTRSISELRRVFEDDAKDSHVIQTIPKRGYRLLAATLPFNGAPTLAAQAPPVAVPGRAVDLASRRKVWIGALTFLSSAVLLFGIAVGFNAGRLRERLWGKSAFPRIQSLAVLPLTNLSGDPSQEYFADGMTDALITDLAQIGSLKVISRTSTVRYKKSDKTLPEIARELNVDGIVEGTVQRSGDRVRITAQLIYGPTDKHVWANSYERDARNVLAMESEIAGAIANQIQTKLSSEQKARLASVQPVNLKAFEAYLQGKYHWTQADDLAYHQGKQETAQSELGMARDYFQKAISEDPNYAPAYVGLSQTWGDEPGTEEWLKPENERKTLEKALELDPALPEAHLALGDLEFFRYWNWSAAEHEIKRAIELNPNLADAYFAYADYLDAMSRFEEGMREYLRGQELSPGHYSGMPNPFFIRRQFDKAIEMDRADIERHAFGAYPHWDLARDYEAKGMHDLAIGELEIFVRTMGYEDMASTMHRGFETSGYKGALKAWVRDMEHARAKGEDIPSNVLAEAYAYLGEKDNAFAWLEKAFEERNFSLPALRVDPTWDNLRADPRFQDLVRRMNFPSEGPFTPAR